MRYSGCMCGLGGGSVGVGCGGKGCWIFFFLFFEGGGALKCACVCELGPPNVRVCERERDKRTIARVYVKQDDGVAADEGHAPGLTGQILLEVRGIKALARGCLFYCCNIH